VENRTKIITVLIKLQYANTIRVLTLYL